MGKHKLELYPIHEGDISEMRIYCVSLNEASK